MYINYAFLFLFCCGFIQEINAQNTTYPMVNEAFEALTTAFGESRPAPTLIINPRNSKQKVLARFIPGINATIKIDEELILLCKEFGKDSTPAFVAILAHELAHYYKEHSWCADFAFALEGESLGEKLKTISKDEKIRLEAQADQVAAFSALMAGYNYFEIYPTLLDKIYTRYQLPDNLPNYPTKQERKVIAAKTFDVIKQLYSIYQSGVILLYIQKYDVATTCFEQVAQKFPSREVLHNLGMCYLLRVLQQLDNIAMPFQLPCLIENSSRFSVRTTQNMGEEHAKYLKQSKKYLEEAIRKDPNFAPAYLNLAIVYLLSDNADAAIGKINELKSQQKTLSSQALMLRAIAYYFASQPDKAMQEMKQLPANTPLLAYNFPLLQYLKATLPNETYHAQLHSAIIRGFKVPKMPIKKTVLQQPVFDMPNFDMLTAKNTLTISNNPMLEWKAYKKNNSSFIELILPNKTYFFAQDIQKLPLDSTQSIFIGQSKEQVLDLLGEPELIFQSIFHYASLHLILRFDDKDLVEEILPFQSKSN